MIVRRIADRLQAAVPPDAHTLEGFRRWARSPDFPEQGRVSLIQGKVWIDMSPERIETHNQVKWEVNNVLGPLVKSADLGRYYPDRAWLTNQAAGLSTEPDAAFASWETLESGRLQVVLDEQGAEDGVELRGTPDWALEVVSPSSQHKGADLLVESYHQAGVPEYWLIHARGDAVQFTIYVYGDAGYVAQTPEDDWLASPVFGRRFRLTRQRDRLGGWRYTLHMAEANSR